MKCLFNPTKLELHIWIQLTRIVFEFVVKTQTFALEDSLELPIGKGKHR
jgi:hypothetical protein